LAMDINMVMKQGIAIVPPKGTPFPPGGH
jgi:hypothetical protein